MTSPLNAAASSSPQTAAETVSLFKSSSESESDWLATSLTTAKVIAAETEWTPFPYVKSVFEAAVTILETVEEMERNCDDLQELCRNIVEIIKIVQDQLSLHGCPAAVNFKGLCEDLEGVLQGVLKLVKQLQMQPLDLNGLSKEIMLSSTADEIASHRMRIKELRLNFMLMTVIDTNLQIHKLFSTGRLPDLPVTSAPQMITNCPPPSRIFHGRQDILDKMHQFFIQDLDNQHSFLLYGQGGAGKTQIALKFITESFSHFSDIFLIDASTTETIDTGLKNIAATHNAGSTAQDSLEWLSSKPAEWLLFFDNADDPRINFNKFFPQCGHGNILITSRNPGLQVYPGSYSLVSGMEEPDAVALMLKSCDEEITPRNKELATEIVKALSYLPLAIVQAGDFISKSGTLSSYLNLYAENQAHLLSQQSHDDFTQTVC